MSEQYDGILLGAGHNTLVAQAYLAKAGLNVISLEKCDLAGGGLRTEEYPAGSGFWHNTHAFYHRGLTHLPWYQDLELERHGARYVQPALNVALLTKDGRCLEWWEDFDKTIASFAQFNTKDAETLARWRTAFQPVVENILEPEAQSPPLPSKERHKLLTQSSEGRLLLEASELSPLEFVKREFEDPTIQAGLLFFNGLREVDLRQRGFGHHIPALLASRRMAQMPVGGAKSLANALVRSVEEAGGTVRTGVTPKRILIENGRAVGVETTTGEVLLARHFVASGLNPQQTFLELIEEDALPTAWRRKATEFEYNLLAPLFALNLNLSEPPRYKATDENPQLDEALMVILGLDHVDQFMDIVAHHEAGTIPPTVMWGTCPTRFDSSQAPSGNHTAFMWEKLPYRLGGDPVRWDAEKERHGEEMLALWKRYAPNLEHAVLDQFTRSPLDVERSLSNMRYGDLLVGAFANGQVGYNRPFPGAGHYRGHIEGLYLCGSSNHPSGNVTGLPGYNSAQVILTDLGKKAAWAPPPIDQRLAGLHG